MNDPERPEEPGLVVKRYEGLVRRLAHSMIGKLPASVELSDLVQVGRIAVWEAYPRFDSTLGSSVETFLTRRIIGSFLDYLRGTDTLSRADRRAVKKLNQCINGASSINRAELAGRMKVDFGELERLLLLREGAVVSGDEPEWFEESGTLFDRLPSTEDDPVEALRTNECLAGIEWAIEKCSPADTEIARQVFKQHFIEGKELAEVGEFLGVTESRVCQLAERLRITIEYRLRYS